MRRWYAACFSRCSIYRRVQVLRLCLLVIFLHSLTKAPDNNTPAIKITSSSVTWSLVCCAFCCSCILVWLQTDFCCCSKLCNKSLQQKSTCVVRVTIVTWIWLITVSGIWDMMQKPDTKHQSTIRTSCSSSWLRHRLNFSSAWWTMRLISGKKRLEARIHADDGHLEHLLWCCLPDIQVATQHNWLLSQPPVTHNTICLFRATNI